MMLLSVHISTSSDGTRRWRNKREVEGTEQFV